jgi:hypothetical protein
MADGWGCPLGTRVGARGSAGGTHSSRDPRPGAPHRLCVRSEHRVPHSSPGSPAGTGNPLGYPETGPCLSVRLLAAGPVIPLDLT